MNEVIVRRYKEKDIPGFYEAVIESQKEVSKWLPWCNEDYSYEDTENWIKKIVPQRWESKTGCEFIIVNSDDRVLGACCLERLNLAEKKADIGYWVRTSETGKGIATSACKFLLNFGFASLGLEKIHVIPSINNKGSKKVGEKLPFESSLIVKDGFKIRENISDAIVYTITRASYKNRVK